MWYLVARSIEYVPSGSAIEPITCLVQFYGQVLRMSIKLIDDPISLLYNLRIPSFRTNCVHDANSKVVYVKTNNVTCMVAPHYECMFTWTVFVQSVQDIALVRRYRSSPANNVSTILHLLYAFAHAGKKLELPRMFHHWIQDVMNTPAPLEKLR